MHNLSLITVRSLQDSVPRDCLCIINEAFAWEVGRCETLDIFCWVFMPLQSM